METSKTRHAMKDGSPVAIAMCLLDRVYHTGGGIEGGCSSGGDESGGGEGGGGEADEGGG